MTGDWLSKTFGHGRRTNRLAVVQCATALFKLRPPRVHQYSLSEALDPWTREVASGCLHGGEENAFDLLWRHWLKEETPADVAEALAGQADAVIVLAPRDWQAPLVEALEERGIPSVVAYACSPDLRAAHVSCDNARGIEQVVHHLAQLGHRHVGYCGGPMEVSDVRARRQGFLEGMAAEGLPVNPDLVVGETLRRMADDYRPLINHLLRHPNRPTAVVCASDYLAVAVVEGAWELGLDVPRDLAVTGFDDSDEATQIIPQITTVRQPVLEIANQACYLAACLVEGQAPETPGWRLELPVSMVVRESSGAALAVGGADGEAELKGEAQTTVMRRELQLRLRQLAAVNEEMQELLYVASHDLRTPLVTIQGFASSLERKYGASLDARGRDYLRRVRSSTDTMRDLIDALLTLSRTNNTPLTFERVRPRAVLERVVRDLGGLIEEKHARVRISSLPRAVLADEVAMYQVFLNLVGNALKFTRNGEAPEVTVGHALRREEYEFYVRDNGVGIAPAQQEEVFQVFRRVGESKEAGSGIGLAIVKRIVLRHGGRVWVESQTDSGATFRFTLPRRSLDHVRHPSAAGAAAAVAHRGG